MIDKALLRPGRIDGIIYVSLPDKEARKDIFKIHLAKTLLANDVVLQDLAERTEIFSGVEILFCVAKQRQLRYKKTVSRVKYTGDTSI